MDWLPHVTVATIVEKDGKYLLVHEHSNDHLVYNQPAGHLDPNESLQQAAVRETLEETGWTVELKGLVGIALYTSPISQVTYHRTTFFAEAISHNSEQPLDEGIEQAVWMSLDEMKAAASQMRSELVIKSVEQYLNGHRYPLGAVWA
jgi:8-oxo-dGTP pyrophosphatase MutT (NUDIX family)